MYITQHSKAEGRLITKAKALRITANKPIILKKKHERR
jgi:hypothetical protein